jgi:hypothetical protein
MYDCRTYPDMIARELNLEFLTRDGGWGLMNEEVIKHQDLSRTERPVADSDRPPPSTRMKGETVEISGGIKMKSRALLLVTYVLVIATITHFALAVNGFLSLVAGLAVVIAVCHPEYATGVLNQISGLAHRFKGK